MPRPMGKPQNKVKNPGKLLMRLMNYIFRDYKFHCIAVFILIFVGVIANVQGTMFIRDLIDKYITPFLLSSDTPNFSPLAHAISRDAALGDMNNRLTDLAEEFKIKNLVNYDFDFESEAKINFNEVDKILKGKQKEFSDYLDNSLNG